MDITTDRPAAVRRILDDILADVMNAHPDNHETSVEEIAACHDRVIAAYRTDRRVKVVNTDSGHVRTGRVSRTTGWRPALLLIHRSNAHGSWDVLGPHDIVAAEQHGRRYIPIMPEWDVMP
jgi:acetaldehyde dehydrogenase (acetylating)